jgi:cytochrome P450
MTTTAGAPSDPLTDESVAAVTVDWLSAQALLDDPYGSYAALRNQGPVVWVPSVNRYLATSFAACVAIEADQETFSATIGGTGATMARALGAPPMLRKDDPQHSEERKVVNPTLRPKNIRAHWAPLFERNAAQHLAELLERGPDGADLNRDYAGPLAAHNLVDMLGFRDVLPEDMRRWSHAFIAGIGNLGDDPTIWARCDAAQDEVDTLLDELIPLYRANPNSSITSALANSPQQTENVYANVKLVISGGMNEPQHLLTNMVWALTQHPEQRARVIADPSQWLAVFDEALRWQSPIGMYPRETTRATVLDGVALPAGASIGVVVAAANRDPDAFDRPEEFDSTREKRQHLGFGAGVHLCAGHWAARVSIGEIAVPLLYRTLGGFRTDPRRAATWGGWVFRGLTALPVTWDAVSDD